MTTKRNTENLTAVLIDKPLLEPYLKFPSGLSLKQAKKNAKQLKNAQGIKQSEAMKVICWGNGIVDIKDYSQAFDKLMQATFNREHNEVGLYLDGDYVVGCWWKAENGGYQSLTSKRAYLTNYNHDEEVKRNISNLVLHLTSINEGKQKPAKFLQAVKECIIMLGHDFYRVSGNKSLAEVTDLYEIDIDINKLLFEGGGSGGETLLSYALASCYNTRATAQLVMERAIEIKYINDEIKSFDISDKEERSDLCDYASEYRHFGAMCYNLDQHSKRIVKGLLDNYHGW